ncbi:hypothetical protein JYU09_00600 [bacterium AH-315-O15]|nr:hypothetical protein [bacterium AH-315-O15]
MNPPLVSAEWLAGRLDDTNVRIVEISPAEDDAIYRAGHISGAVWFNWKSLCWHDSDREFATPTEIGERLGRVGISHDTDVVLYGDPVQYGTYAFWVLDHGRAPPRQPA